MTVMVRNQITGKKRYYTGTNPCKGATVHMTANTNKGANAARHADLQSRGNVREASWHVTIDDKEAVQSYEDKRRCWHAGDGRGPGNYSTISYELCVNSDGDYVKMLYNAAERIAMDVVEYGWKRSDIKQHKDYSPWGKNCPRELRGGKSDISWNQFVDLIFEFAGEGSAPVAPEKPTPVKPKPKPKPSEIADGYTEVDGYWGIDTSLELQYALDTPIDGEVWRQTKRWAKKNRGLTHGWKWNGKAKDAGSPVIKALHTFLSSQGVPASVLGRNDGKIGPKHIKGLQTWLKSVGLYDRSIDGELWAKSPAIKGLQKALNEGLIK